MSMTQSKYTLYGEGKVLLAKGVVTHEEDIENSLKGPVNFLDAIEKDVGVELFDEVVLITDE